VEWSGPAVAAVSPVAVRQLPVPAIRCAAPSDGRTADGYSECTSLPCVVDGSPLLQPPARAAIPPINRSINQQEAFEKCWAHSPREPSHAHSAGVATGTVARRLRIDDHDDNDNA